MSDYYEHVDRPTLRVRARRRKFPLRLLCVALNQYQGQRLVTYETMAVVVGYPGRGLAAGCGYATFLVQVYTLDPFETWQRNNEALALT
eukprot:3296460-Pyramimonas_sp.AAC.1